MSDQWEKAVRVAEHLAPVLNPEDEAMKLRQREIWQEQWNKELDNVDKGTAPAPKQLDSSSSWATAYDQEPESPSLNDNLTLQVLKSAGRFYTQRGVAGSVELLIHEINQLEAKLAKIKSSLS